MIEVELPDGSIAEFPDGTGNDVIKGALQKRFGGAPKVDPTTNQPPGVPAFSPPGVEGYDPQSGEVSRPYSRAGSAGMGFADTAGLGLADEGAAGVGYLLDKLPGGQGRGYSQILGEINRDQDAAFNQNPGSYRVGEGAGIVGGIAGGAINAGVRGATTAAPSLLRMATQGLGFGSAMGAVSGFGSGRDLPSRLIGAGAGSVAGGAIGGAAPYAIAGLSAAASPFIAPLAARLNPEKYTNSALGKTLGRSGKTADEIADMLTRAQADDQGMFTVADAMGHAGQRGISTVVRNPNEARQQIVDALTGRQMGQGERLSNFLAEGFGAPDTAAQRAASLTGQRATTANANYGAARTGSGAVDTSGAIRAADDFLTPGATGLMNPGTNIADDSIEGAVRKARAYLTDGKSNLSDFNASLRAKQELDAMIEGAKPAVQRQLIPIRNALDDALEATSPDYAKARNVFRQQSRAIDAIDTGRSAASGRTRAPDNISTFNGMAPAEQDAFRAGYVDPFIAKTESSAIAPLTNKARPLMTTKTGQEFPEFAAPGKADQLGNRIAREQQMFDTAKAALGGSQTSDNLADSADMAQFDPAIMAQMFTNPVKAAGTAVLKALKAGQGLPPSVLSRVGEGLMTTDPAIARSLLQPAASQTSKEALKKQIIQMLLTNAGASGTPRLIAQ